MNWQTMNNAPKDRPVLGWCVHAADAYIEDDGKTLTDYAANAEGIGHCDDGLQLLVWGPGYHLDEDEGGGWMPGCWFVKDDDAWNTPANPILWAEAVPPTEQQISEAMAK